MLLRSGSATVGILPFPSSLPVPLPSHAVLARLETVATLSVPVPAAPPAISAIITAVLLCKAGKELTMRYVVCTAIALICASLRAQTPPARPQFEVASVKLAANDGLGGGPPRMVREMMRNNRQPGMIAMMDPGRIRLENWALLDLIAAAYSVRANQVSGPAWLSDSDELALVHAHAFRLPPLPSRRRVGSFGA